MDTDTTALFFAILTVIVDAFVLGALIGAAVVRFAPTSSLAERVLSVRDLLAPDALWGATVIALVTMLGSLYLSEIADYPPCKLCWYQRIAMYPLAVILIVASLRKDRAVWTYVVPLGVIGLGISVYHYLIERFPASVSFACTDDVPCTTVWIWKFGFLSIPAMAGIGFAATITLVLLARSSAPSALREPATEPSDETSDHTHFSQETSS